MPSHTPHSSSSLLPTMLLSLLLLQSQNTQALHIGAASPCYDQCDGSALTETKHLSCLDAAYDTSSGTAAGQQMRECLTCTETSSYANASDSATDQYWFMFHLKYTQQYCLFDSAATQISDCGVQCSPLQSVLTTLWANTSPPRFLYDYCTANSEVYPNYAPDCATCLKNRTGTVVLGNFMETMYSACENKPNITTDSSAFFEIKAANGDLFNSNVETATGQSAPTATDNAASVPSATDATRTGSAQEEGANTAAAASPSGTSTENGSSGSSDSGLSTGASIGIGVGVSGVAIAAIIGVVFFILRRRRIARSRNALADHDDKAGFMANGSPVFGNESASGWKHSPQQQQPWGGDGAGNSYVMDHQLKQQYAHTQVPAEMSAGSMMRSEMPAGNGHVAELPADSRR